MATDGIVLTPVDSDQHVHMLREYRKLVQSTMGPSGSCKAVVTGGGYLELISTSSVLMARLELASPICKYINNMAAGLKDHGLYCAILLSHLLEQLWQEHTLSKHKTTQIIGVLVNELRTLLESVCIKVDFDTIRNFIPLVRTIITSKCPVLLSGMDVDGLCIEVIKVFLNCVDDETNLINKVYTKVESGPNTFTSYKGLLYNVSESYNIETARGLTGEVKILVFNLKLEDNDEKLFSTLDKMKKILDCAVQSGVKVVACQKTISSEIKLLLRRSKIVVLERMGTDFTKMLINISNAFPISQLHIDESEVGKLTGQLTSIQHIQFNECDYLVLHNENVTVGTLLIQSCSLVGEDFVKELRKEREFSIVSTWVQRALQSTCSAVDMDTLYHHGWKEEVDTCNCRLVKRREAEREGASWVMLQEVVNSQLNLQSPLLPDMTLQPNVLVESHQQKLQVLCAVFEAFANLSDIGLIVCEG